MSRLVYTCGVGFGLAFLILPLAVVMPLAFNGGNYLSYPLEGLSLRWFGVVLHEAPWLSAIANSFRVALGATAISVVVGGLAALGTMASSRLTAVVLSLLFVSPLAVPSIVLAVALYFAFARVGMTGGYGALVLAHALLGAPLVFVSVMNSLKGLPPELDQAAASMGASRLMRFRTVTLPLTLPGFLTGAIFAFVTSFDEVVIALFLVSPETQTLPIALFAALRDRLEPTLVVVALLLTLFSTLFILALSRLRRAASKVETPHVP